MPASTYEDLEVKLLITTKQVLTYTLVFATECITTEFQFLPYHVYQEDAVLPA